MDCYLRMQEDKALQRTEDVIGPQTVIASRLGLFPSSINNYFNRSQPMPVYVAQGIALMTKPTGESMKVTYIELIGLLEPREKTAAIVKAIDDVQENKLDYLERPLLGEHIYSHRYTGKRSMPFFLQWLMRCTFTQALKLAGIKDREEYYCLKEIRETAIDAVRKAVNKGQLKPWQGALLAALPDDEQAQLMQLSHAKLLAEIKRLKGEGTSAQPIRLCAVDYLRLLQNDEDILPLKTHLSFFNTLAIHFAIEIILGTRQGQRSDLQKTTKIRQKAAFLDEVNSIMARVEAEFKGNFRGLDEVRSHVMAMMPISDDVTAFFANHKGRTDDLLAKQMGLKRQTYRYLKSIFIKQPELILLIEAGDLSIFNAYQQAKAKQQSSLINSHKEKSL